ncbi:MAG: nitroreductase family protein [Sphingobium sp.]
MTSRQADHPVDRLFIDRWSPRAFDATAIPQADLDTIMEAARWAPSAFNHQPWRFLYAHRDGEAWDSFLGLLLPFNQAWAQRASVLIFVLSDTLIDQVEGVPKPFRSHAFDAGAAWAQLALQTTRLGYHAHGMTGVDFAAARTALAVPDRFEINAAVAIGRRGDPSYLSESLRAREQPSGRKPITDIAFEGAFPQ